jgi:hypothetical protein
MWYRVSAKKIDSKLILQGKSNGPRICNPRAFFIELGKSPVTGLFICGYRKARITVLCETRIPAILLLPVRLRHEALPCGLRPTTPGYGKAANFPVMTKIIAKIVFKAFP